MAQWWDEWQLRILVLASLCAQYFLVLFAGVRKFHIPPWLKHSFRLAHIGSDILAIFALATLFNRQKGGPRCSYARGSRDLELLWAPVVLMHLGGQVVITSYKIKDNDKSSRYILTSLSKVTIALYVFYKSWSSDDKKLLAATVLLFVLVIIRCVQKAVDLKSSSFNALRKDSSTEASVVVGTVAEKRITVDEYVKLARCWVLGLGCSDGPLVGGTEPLSPLLQVKDPDPRPQEKLFLDIPCPYLDRVGIMRNFWSLGKESAYRKIEDPLSAMANFLYTKDDSRPYHDSKKAPAALIFRRCTQVLVYITLVTTICLIHTSSHKEAYIGEDNWVTLVLLYGTLLLELVYLGVQTAFRYRFSGRMDQHNLIGLLARNKWHSWLSSIARWLKCKDYLNIFWHMKPISKCEEITELVRLHVQSWWKQEHIVNGESYKMFNDTRGDWTITSGHYKEKLDWSTQRPFDESIVLWHLATDLCFHHRVTADDVECARQCKEMSNYMMHLLSENPEMLMPGSRKSLFKKAYKELDDILKGEKTPRNEKEFTEKLIEKHNAGSFPDSFVGDACVLAKTLYGYGDVWGVIKGVWIEMLCFSAGRSRGYLHAEALGTGVEYLSYVWLLWAYLGMEAFPEKLHRREGQPVKREDGVVGPSAVVAPIVKGGMIPPLSWFPIDLDSEISDHGVDDSGADTSRVGHGPLRHPHGRHQGSSSSLLASESSPAAHGPLRHPRGRHQGPRSSSPTSDSFPAGHGLPQHPLGRRPGPHSSPPTSHSSPDGHGLPRHPLGRRPGPHSSPPMSESYPDGHGLHRHPLGRRPGPHSSAPASNSSPPGHGLPRHPDGWRPGPHSSAPASNSSPPGHGLPRHPDGWRPGPHSSPPASNTSPANNGLPQHPHGWQQGSHYSSPGRGSSPVVPAPHSTGLLQVWGRGDGADRH